MTASINFNSEPYFGQRKIEYSKYSYINSNYSAAIFDRLAINTTAGSFTITLPNTSLISSGQIEIYDVGGKCATNNAIINPNGIKLMDYINNVVIDIDNVRLLFIYIDAIIGWRIVT